MSMAVKYAMSKRRKAGGSCPSCQGAGCDMCEGGMMAHGGLVDRIMAKKEAWKPEADFEDADYDVTDEMEKPEKLNYTGANSGDEIGDDELYDQDESMVSRIMRKRAARGKMPHPA